MKWIKSIFVLIFIATLLLAVILAIGVWNHPSQQQRSPWGGPPPKNQQAWERLSQAITYQTISFNDSAENTLKWNALRTFKTQLAIWYPKCFNRSKIDSFSAESLMLTFKGSDVALKPIVFLAHMDVVPVAFEDLHSWKHPPFQGNIFHDTIWGRGALDDKLSVLGLLEAMEAFLNEGKQLKRTVIFAFGGDEESSGSGAASMAHHLANKGIKAELVLDEGLGVMKGIVPGINQPTALIGIAEKGFASLELTVELPGGHSSTPEKENALSVLNSAVYKVNNGTMPAAISEPMKKFFTAAAPEMSMGYRALFSNLWLTKHLIINVLDKNSKTAASIRTTKVTTVMHAGVMDVVVPNKARAIINLRIIPGETLEMVKKRIIDMIEDARVKVRFFGKHYDPSPISPTHGFGYHAMVLAIEKTYKDVVVIPSLVIATTDARHYASISDAVYRFLPARFSNKNIPSIHGINECISTYDFDETIAFYTHMIEQCR